MRTAMDTRTLVLLLSMLLPSFSIAQSVEIDPRVKAAFVYNLLKFTDWPTQAGRNTVTLCVAHTDNALESAFSAINGRIANGRTVTLRFVLESSDLKPCNVIYVHNGPIKKILSHISTHQKDLLTISDARNFIESGGVIGMLLGDDGHLQFEINLETSRNASYVLSSQLLKLARNTQ